MPSAWHPYRFWTRFCWAIVLGYVPVLLSLCILTDAPHSQMMLMWLGYVAIICFTSFKALSFRCPRCGQFFFRKSFCHNTLTKRCLHCGLLKWEEPTDGKDILEETRGDNVN
jgi:predicted RNA-binding Zn-ribbon protein involved in translation (DUF1610 family)